MDDLADLVDQDRQKGQGQKGIGGQSGCLDEHQGDQAYKKGQGLYPVHDGRTRIHTDLVDILTDTVHQIPDPVVFVKVEAQQLIMVEHLIFKVVFDITGYVDDRLAHQKGEQGGKQSGPYDDQDVLHQLSPSLGKRKGVAQE